MRKECRAEQYWQVENLKSFDEFLESAGRPDSGRRTGQKLASSLKCLACWEMQYPANRTVETMVLE